MKNVDRIRFGHETLSWACVRQAAMTRKLISESDEHRTAPQTHYRELPKDDELIAWLALLIFCLLFQWPEVEHHLYRRGRDANDQAVAAIR